MRKNLQSLLQISFLYQGLSSFIFIAALVSNIYAADIVLYDAGKNTAPDRQGWFSNLSVSVSALCGLCEKCSTISPDSFCYCGETFVSSCASPISLRLCEIRHTSSEQKAEQEMTNLNTAGDVKDIAGYFSRLPDISLLPDMSELPPDFSALPPECSDLASIPGISEIHNFSAAPHPDVPVLDRFLGFTLRFQLQLLTETAESREEAGFSLILICNDKKGLELGFQSDEIRVRDDNSDFTAGESATLDTASLTLYSLVIQGSSYKLYADSDSLKEPILSGRLRDYTAYQNAFFPDIYNTSDFLFFGDSSTAAGAEINLASVSVRIHKKRGDINGDDHIGLDDAVLAFQICTGNADLSGFPEYRISDADVNGDSRIGLEEAVYILGEMGK